MGYKIDSIKEIKCPCGKGVIKKVSKSNEWDQSKEDISIICEDCEKKFVIDKDIIFLNLNMSTLYITVRIKGITERLN